jgi:hypothetical protein
MTKNLKHFICLYFVLNVFAVVHADHVNTSYSTPQMNRRTSHWNFEPSVSYFRPQSDGLRDIYGSSWISNQLSIGYTPSRHWNLQLKGEIMQNQGKTKGLQEKTKLRMMPLTLYVNWVYYQSSTVNFYLGAGPQCTYVKKRTHSKFLRGHESKTAFGGAGILGCVKELDHWLAFDLFASYSYVRIKGSSYGNIKSVDRTYGGLGAGMGFQFKF